MVHVSEGKHASCDSMKRRRPRSRDEPFVVRPERLLIRMLDIESCPNLSFFIGFNPFTSEPIYEGKSLSSEEWIKEPVSSMIIVGELLIFVQSCLQ